MRSGSLDPLVDTASNGGLLGPVGNYGSAQVTASSLASAQGLEGARAGTRRDYQSAGIEVVGQDFPEMVGEVNLGAEEGGALMVSSVGQPNTGTDYPGNRSNLDQAAMFTPTRRTPSGRATLANWTSRLEGAPAGFGWMSRLGDYLRNRAELLPSPFPGASPDRDRDASSAASQVSARNPTPPRQTAIAGLLGSNFFTTDPPSSSSGIPSEVIQEEVQRQLKGVLERLELSESRNRHLEQQLEAVRQSRERTAEAERALEALQHPRRQAAEAALEAQQHSGGQAAEAALEAQQHSGRQATEARLEASAQSVGRSTGAGPRLPDDDWKFAAKDPQAYAPLQGLYGTTGDPSWSPVGFADHSNGHVGQSEVRNVAGARVGEGQESLSRQGILQGLLARVREASPLRDTSTIGASPSDKWSREIRGIGTSLSSEQPLRDTLSVGRPQGSTSVPIPDMPIVGCSFPECSTATIVASTGPQ